MYNSRLSSHVPALKSLAVRGGEGVRRLAVEALAELHCERSDRAIFQILRSDDDLKERVRMSFSFFIPQAHFLAAMANKPTVRLNLLAAAARQVPPHMRAKAQAARKRIKGMEPRFEILADDDFEPLPKPNLKFRRKDFYLRVAERREELRRLEREVSQEDRRSDRSRSKKKDEAMARAKAAVAAQERAQTAAPKIQNGAPKAPQAQGPRRGWVQPQPQRGAQPQRPQDARTVQRGVAPQPPLFQPPLPGVAPQPKAGPFVPAGGAAPPAAGEAAGQEGHGAPDEKGEVGGGGGRPDAAQGQEGNGRVVDVGPAIFFFCFRPCR